ncbi:MAG: LuxR C-terminal-related transcriptional regulator [Thermoleophilaceae bacterium]
MSAAALPVRRRSRSRLRVVPSSRPSTTDVTARPRLVRRLCEAVDVPLVLICAPAGYGKTALLTEWERADPRPFVRVAVGEAPDELASGRPLVVVVDEPDDVEGVGELVDGVPRGSQLVLVTRSETAVPLGRLRVQRAVTEVRARDLVMSATEGAALLAGAGLDLPPAVAEPLVQRTEGWPAGLYLAAVSLREAPDPVAAASRFRGDDLVVADYLREEMLAYLPRATVAFLRRSSVLDRLSGPVCDAVLGRRGSARLLAELGRANLLLVPLDRKGEGYRCHELLRDMLRAELRRLEPELEPELHMRASDWCAADGDMDQAIEHALAAGDTARAGDLVWLNAPGHVAHGRNVTIERWLGRFEHEQIAAHPALAAAAAYSSLARGELDAVERYERVARRSPELGSAAALLRAAVGREGLARMGEEASQACELEPADSPWRSLGCLLAGVAQHLMGDRTRAEAALDDGARRATVLAPSVQTLCLSQRALLAAECDAWDSVALLAARARAQLDRYGLVDYPTAALVLAVSALARAHRGRVEEAQEDLRQGRALLEALSDFAPWYLVETRVVLARAAVRLGDVVAGRELLADAERLAGRVPEAVVLREWIDDAEAQAAAISASAVRTPSSLTTAELRILRFLPTHLSFREIAGRLYVSANTVKTQAHAVYRKLDASSRSEAVAHAMELGLLDA